MLAQVLRPIQQTFDPARFPDLLVGLEGPDDAAVYRLTDDLGQPIFGPRPQPGTKPARGR